MLQYINRLPKIENFVGVNTQILRKLKKMKILF